MSGLFATVQDLLFDRQDSSGFGVPRVAAWAAGLRKPQSQPIVDQRLQRPALAPPRQHVSGQVHLLAESVNRVVTNPAETREAVEVFRSIYELLSAHQRLAMFVLSVTSMTFGAMGSVLCRRKRLRNERGKSHHGPTGRLLGIESRL